jgi:hypothetical protein
MNILPCQPTDKPDIKQIPPTTSASASSKEVAQPAKAEAEAQVATPYELYYGLTPDYRTLFQWGCIGFYRRTERTGNFDSKKRVGITLGRSNQTNAMIVWDAATGCMNVMADYKLDPMASTTNHFPRGEHSHGSASVA